MDPMALELEKQTEYYRALPKRFPSFCAWAK
jgi:hypothetical protein